MWSKKILQQIALTWSEFPRMPYGVFNKKLPRLVARSMNCPLKLLLNLTPLSILRLMTPQRFTYLLVSASYELGISESRRKKLLSLNFPEKSQNLVLGYLETEKYYTTGKLPNFESQLKSLDSDSFDFQQRKLKSIIKWSFWTVNHSDFNQVNKTVKNYLFGLPKTGQEMKRRYLPQHTSNMGHLAMLFLYINYYRKRDPKRILVLPQGNSANSYYLDLILRHSPMQIEFADNAEFLRQSPTMIDTLHYSLDSNENYRTESDCAFYSEQEHPEFLIEDEFKLQLNFDEVEQGYRTLETYLNRKIPWFVTLHVRQPKNGDLKFSQVRDADVANYRLVAELVSKMGGLVIRMGDTSFPPLRRSFPAFDYAHSQIKSEFMDVWLWSQSRRWIGTVNGAAFPPITFGTPRILTDQWYWYSTGPSTDLVLRKDIEHEGAMLNNLDFDPTWVFSRTMSRSQLQRNGYTVRENNAEMLAKVVAEELENYPMLKSNLTRNQMRLVNESQ